MEEKNNREGKLSRILRSLGVETFANFWRGSESVSENLVSEKKSRFWFQKIWSRKKSIGFGNLVSEKSLGIGQNFGIVIQCPVDGNVPSSMT